MSSIILFILQFGTAKLHLSNVRFDFSQAIKYYKKFVKL